MSGRNVQRKLGTTRGSLRRSRTAKTSRISRRAVKSRCAHEWGGWGRLSDDGSRQHNSGKSEDPWGSGNPTSWRCTIKSATRHCAGLAWDHEVHEGWRQTGGHGVYVGSRLKRLGHPGRHHLKCQPSSRIGETRRTDDRGDRGKEQPTRPQSSGVQVPAPPIACLRAVSISDARGGNEPRSART